MLLSHTVVLAEARSHIAGLADNTTNFDSAMEYERVPLQLDWLDGETVPPIKVVATGDRNVMFRVARGAIAHLEEHAVEPRAGDLPERARGCLGS